tara:strand:+ start:265 stop:2349 length:2085 start_codon:yes stop_codon:yes gene_type:complete
MNFEEYKNTLDKEPTEPDSKKEYIVGCYNPEDWKFIHEVLMKDGTLEDNIPTRNIDCVDEYKHSPVRGAYLLNDTEVDELRKHKRVEYVNINTSKYPGTYAIDPVQLMDLDTKEDRYSSTVKHFKDHSSSSNAFNSTASSHKNRTTYQQLRLQQKERFWTDDSVVFDNKGEQWGTGKDVDVIVCDQDAWFGHIEFQNNLGGPQNYVGGNVLPGNGTCDLLDLILDAPYYLDPDFFNANASRRTTRWDGTTVPTESAARAWWSNNSTTYRSAKFVSSGNGGSATGADDFGILSVNTSYTRRRCNGSNTAYQTGYGSHGTPCASQAYGRQYGWAYNANKWYLNLYGSGNQGTEKSFDIIKVFHQVKPVNSTYGNKNPTITSNSFGYRPMTPPSSGYYWYRPATTDGTTSGTSYSSKPKFIDNFYQTSIRTELKPTSMLTAGVEMIDAGVIMCCSAGNTNQKLVGATHPDYNNYINSSDNVALLSTTISAFGVTWYRTINRQGFPAQVGQQGTGDDRIYRTICVGALDSAHRNSNTGQEQKAYYSNMGELIDCYAPAIDTLAACDDNESTRYNRNDAYYTISGQQSVESEDTIFGGTSSATPITCGMIATKLQYNRTWSWYDVKNWLKNQVGTQDTSEFYHGTEETSATSSGWLDPYAVHDSDVTVIWDALTGVEITSKVTISGGDLTFSGNITINN